MRMKIRIALFIIGLVVMTLSGCSLVPTDFMPKAVWAWSPEAKAYRAEKAERAKWLKEHPQKQTKP